MKTRFTPGTIVTYAGHARFIYSVNRDLQEAFNAIAYDNLSHVPYNLYIATNDDQMRYICSVVSTN